MCTVLMKLKIIALAPLLDDDFLCFGEAKIAIVASKDGTRI